LSGSESLDITVIVFTAPPGCRTQGSALACQEQVRSMKMFTTLDRHIQHFDGSLNFQGLPTRIHMPLTVACSYRTAGC
jgi:hypothetical protein